MALFALLLTFLAVADGAPPADKGILCILQGSGQQCRAAEGTTLEVAAAESPRAFVWTSADGSRVVLGVIAAKASTVSIAEKSHSDITLILVGDRRRGWPLDTRITLASRDRQWAFPLSAKAVTKLRSLRVPPGSYQMTIAAEHHMIARRALNAAKNVALGEVVLKPLPVIFGRVVDMKGEPVAGAQLVRPDEEIQTATNEQGAFRAEVEEPIPDEILVTREHFASTLIPLVNPGGDIDLGVIKLGQGLTLTLRLKRPDVENIPLHVRLLRESQTKNEPSPIAERDLQSKEDQVSFRDLSAGKYVVVVEGSDPLQRLSKKFEVAGAETEGEIDIAPFRLEGSIRIGDEPLHGGIIDLRDAFHSWRVNVPIDDLGRFGGSMWQTGFVSGFVNASALHELVDSPDLGADPSKWEIFFKQRYIRGRVFDEETNQPVEQPSLRLQIASTDGQANSTVPIEADGRYSILAVRAGTYELRAEAPDHLPARAVINVAAEDATDRKVDLPLARGFEQVIELTWPSGQAVAGAAVLEGIASDGYNPERTYAADGAGHVTFNLRRGEVKTVYVLPREGSFAVAHIVAPESSEAKPLRLVVPEPTAALRVEMRDAGGSPLPAMLLLRFNGELIPQPVVLRLTGQYENATSVRVPNLPAGAYEFWAVPVVNYAFAPLIGAVPSRPPLRIGLTTGEQVVKLVAAPLDR